jgi:riboflavin synthase
VFTGIIMSLGRIVDLQPHRIVVDAPNVDEVPGASIAIDGCCLTVVTNDPSPDDPSARRFSFDVLPETVINTRLATLAPGTVVNVEPALRAGEPLGGHMVQGHVDTVGIVRSTHTDPDGRWLDLEIDVPQEVLDLCIERGSITVNGVSLTVMALDDDGIRLQLIPETQQRTNLGALVVGDAVNLEADVIARYVARLLPSSR